MFSHNTRYNKFLNCKKRWISQTSKKNAGWNEKKRKEVMWDRNSDFYTHTVYNYTKYDLYGRQESRKSWKKTI